MPNGLVGICPQKPSGKKPPEEKPGNIFPWGMQWGKNMACVGRDVKAGPVAVGSFPKGASPYGCLDMAGNVWEWVNDWYDRFYYEGLHGRIVDPKGPADGASPKIGSSKPARKRATSAQPARSYAEGAGRQIQITLAAAGACGAIPTIGLMIPDFAARQAFID